MKNLLHNKETNHSSSCLTQKVFLANNVAERTHPGGREIVFGGLSTVVLHRRGHGANGTHNVI